MNHDQTNAALRQSAPKGVRRQLALTTALLSAGVIGYGGRAAYAGSCTGLGGTYTCTGAATGSDVTQALHLIGVPLTVTVADGFGIDVASGNAFRLLDGGALNFTDTYGAAITGSDNGIEASVSNSLSVTTTGAVIGTVLNGIDAVVGSPSVPPRHGDLTISAADVSGGNVGIYAINEASESGVLSVTATGTVSGAAGDGIYADSDAGDLTISAADVSGGDDGIDAKLSGRGALSVTATGAVSGAAGDGIFARNDVSGSILTISAADVTGSDDGIEARNYGSGFLSVTATGAVSGAGGDGIVARNDVSGSNLTISAADVTGSDDGIEARNYGSGALSVTATGAVSAAGNDGIFALNDGTDLTIAAAAVTGGYFGINARNAGSGALSVTSTGAVSGTGGVGIYASSDSTDLTIDAAAVSGDYRGIEARNTGSGFLSVTATGTVKSTRSDGIFARNDGTDLTISAADVTGGYIGINARNSGSGALSVTATGTVSGRVGGVFNQNANGIYARNDIYGSDLTIAVNNVTGGDSGIDARNFGSGELSVTATGAVSGGSPFGDGIRAINGGDDGLVANGTGVTIAAADVTGGRNGILVGNGGNGGGVLSVTATGAVRGGTGAGIAAFNGTGTTITLNDGASVSAASGVGIIDDGGGATVTVNTGASVTGAIRLGDGRDSLNFDGGDFSGVTAFDGGGGAEDALRFGAGAAGVLDASLVTGFETLHFGAGSAVSVFDALIADVFVEAGGALGPGASPGTLFVDGAFGTAAGATLSFELGGLTPGTGYDVLDVAGTASLADATMFEILGFGGFLPTIGNSFDILIADDIFLSSLSNLTFDFDIGGSWSFGIFDVGGREALRLEAIAPPVAPVPVPPALAMFGSGLVGLFGLGWVRRRNQRPAA